MRDEIYILNLCDNLLQKQSLRQHRFPFLLGDTGVKLPIDAFYPELNLVIEYHERQHSETVPFFDKKLVYGGKTRGEQRKIYDERRREVLPKHNLQLIEFDYSEFLHNRNRRLLRYESEDLIIIQKKIQQYI